MTLLLRHVRVHLSFGVLLFAAAALGAQEEPFKLSIQENRVTLEAEGASARQILDRIARELGIDVTFPAGWDAESTLELEDARLEDAVAALTRNWSFIERVDQDGVSRPTRLIVLPGGAPTPRPAEAPTAFDLVRQACEALRPLTDAEAALQVNLVGNYLLHPDIEPPITLRRILADYREALDALDEVLQFDKKQPTTLSRILEDNATAIELFERSLNLPDDEPNTRVLASPTQRLIKLYLAKYARKAAEGDHAALPAMANALKFARDVGRRTSFGNKREEDHFRGIVLDAVRRASELDSLPPDSLANAVRVMDTIDRRASPFAAGWETASPNIRILPPEASGESAVSMSGFAEMPPLEAAELAKSVLQGEGRLEGELPRPKISVFSLGDCNRRIGALKVCVSAFEVDVGGWWGPGSGRGRIKRRIGLTFTNAGAHRSPLGSLLRVLGRADA